MLAGSASITADSSGNATFAFARQSVHALSRTLIARQAMVGPIGWSRHRLPCGARICV